jgi:general secretion pathway protein D
MKKTFVLILVIIGSIGYGEDKLFQSLEFNNQKITDILLTFGAMTDYSLTWDETVEGKAAFTFSNKDYAQAFFSFLKSQNLYYDLENGIYHISRIKIDTKESDLINVQVSGVEPELFLRKLSNKLNKTIAFDPFPRKKLYLSEQHVSLEELLTIVAAQYSEFYLEKTNSFFRIREQLPNAPQAAQKNIIYDIKDGIHNLKVTKATLYEVLRLIFSEEKKKYVSLLDKRTLMDGFNGRCETFTELIKYIAEWCGGLIRYKDEITYLLPKTRKHDEDRFKEIFTQDLSPNQITGILERIPRSLFEGNFIIDEPGGKLIFIGMQEEFKLLRNILNALPETSELQNQSVRPIYLNYITSQELLANPPPLFNRKNLFPGPGESLLFHLGTEKAYREMIMQVGFADKKEPLINYKVLIIRYTRTADTGKKFQFENSSIARGYRNVILGSLGELLSLNFNIITTFGYAFAFSLSSDMAENRASVLADISLTGLSGEKISFTNTDTYRYRDSEIDPDSGKAVIKGVTRELTSGLILDIAGRCHSDDEITLDFSAALSKRGVDLSQRSGNPPPTSERLLKTKVTVEYGVPVLAGSLYQQEISKASKSAPFLGKLLGRTTKSREEIEIAFYVTASVEDETVENGGVDYDLIVETLLGVNDASD